MKKFLFVMMALVATFAFTACEKSESQVFDLTYDETTGDQAEIMAYQQNYREIFIQELSAVAKPVTEAGTTFVIDGTKSSAVKTATAAFNKAGEKAQQKAVAKYMKTNYDEIKVRVPKGKREVIQTHAEKNGESVNAFINRIIDQEMEKDAGD